MRRGWLLSLALIATMVLVPAVQAAPGDGAAEEGPFGGIGSVFTDPNQPVEVAAGETFRIVLDSNRTTGYGWQLAELSDETVVKKVHNRYRAPLVQRPGAGGQEVWRFQAVKPGTAEIRMVYVRPWEKGIEPARTAVFKVTVK